MRTRIKSWLGDTLSSHRFKRGETHVDGVETAARGNGQDESRNADDGEDQKKQYGKRYQSLQNRFPPAIIVTQRSTLTGSCRTQKAAASI
jgi:hypothetical protein